MVKSKRDSEAAYLVRKTEERARAQEKQAKQRTQRRVAIAVALGVLIAGAVAIPVLLRGDKASPAEQLAKEAAKRPLADFGVKATEAGCSDTTTETPKEDWTEHIKGEATYPVAPPAGGPHSASTVSMGSDRFYERAEKPAPEAVVHDLEHGLVVAWYDAALPAAEVAALKQVAASAGDKELRFIAVPWDREAFTADRHLVLTAWGVTQRCQRTSGAAIEAFVTKHADAPGLQERNFPV